MGHGEEEEEEEEEEREALFLGRKCFPQENRTFDPSSFLSRFIPTRSVTAVSFAKSPSVGKI